MNDVRLFTVGVINKLGTDTVFRVEKVVAFRFFTFDSKDYIFCKSLCGGCHMYELKGNESVFVNFVNFVEEY